ncbi:CueP family metal-binding protein [Microbacterium betulae]|uniref:CueP family metal-binding protein n=1 Tax=Microbacterium betulae TaxID=2981139 RepID=A0AA97I609_9MICO|nr:CueP family metal-binding protein [Microbacterium sp. AB]WOF24331.1 CueP family metal-binding protein [Microbacterium sp. AB]
MTSTRRAALLSAAAIALTLTISSCTASDPAPSPAASSPEGSSAVDDESLEELAGLGAEEIIAALEAVPVSERRDDLRASVESNQVLLSSDGEEISVPVPEGQHHLSVAPYVSSTHDCYYHSLTTCTGELGGEEVTVRIVDDESGEVYVDESTALHDSGYIGFWLPQDRTVTVTVTSDAGEGTVTTSTGEDDLTCLTSLQLT